MNFKKNKTYIALILIGLAILIFAGIKFFKSGDSKSKSAENQNSENNFSDGQYGRRGPGGNRAGIKPVSGTIESISGQTIKIKTDNESSKNIICSDETRISEQVDGEMSQLSLSDLMVGDKINVMTEDSSSSDIKARMIMVGEFTPPQNRGQTPSDASNDYPQSNI